MSMFSVGSTGVSRAYQVNQPRTEDLASRALQITKPVHFGSDSVSTLEYAEKFDTVKRFAEEIEQERINLRSIMHMSTWFSEMEEPMGLVNDLKKAGRQIGELSTTSNMGIMSQMTNRTTYFKTITDFLQGYEDLRQIDRELGTLPTSGRELHALPEGSDKLKTFSTKLHTLKHRYKFSTGDLRETAKWLEKPAIKTFLDNGKPFPTEEFEALKKRNGLDQSYNSWLRYLAAVFIAAENARKSREIADSLSGKLSELAPEYGQKPFWPGLKELQTKVETMAKMMEEGYELSKIRERFLQDYQFAERSIRREDEKLLKERGIGFPELADELSERTLALQKNLQLFRSLHGLTRDPNLPIDEIESGKASGMRMRHILFLDVLDRLQVLAEDRLKKFTPMQDRTGLSPLLDVDEMDKLNPASDYSQLRTMYYEDLESFLQKSLRDGESATEVSAISGSNLDSFENAFLVPGELGHTYQPENRGMRFPLGKAKAVLDILETKERVALAEAGHLIPGDNGETMVTPLAYLALRLNLFQKLSPLVNGRTVKSSQDTIDPDGKAGDKLQGPHLTLDKSYLTPGIPVSLLPSDKMSDQERNGFISTYPALYFHPNPIREFVNVMEDRLLDHPFSHAGNRWIYNVFSKAINASPAVLDEVYTRRMITRVQISPSYGGSSPN